MEEEQKMEQNKLLKLGLQYFADEQNNNGEEENNGDHSAEPYT